MRKALIIIGLPIFLCWTVGALMLENIAWMLYLDYSNSYVRGWLAYLGLMGLFQSACLKFMLDHIEKHKNRKR